MYTRFTEPGFLQEVHVNRFSAHQRPMFTLTTVKNAQKQPKTVKFSSG